MKKLIYIITCLFLFFAGLFFVYDSYYIISNNKATILSPNFMNKGYEEVKKEAELLGLQLEVVTREHSDYPKDFVYLQTPEPYKTIKNSRTIKIALSLGPYEMKLKNFLNLSLKEAKAELTHMGLTLKNISYVYNELPFNTVIATYPLDTGVLYKKREISLLVSAGLKNKIVKMPSLVGLSYDKAIELLNSNELINMEPRYIDSKKLPKGTVIFQNYGPNKELQSGTFVDLIISK